MKNLLSPWITRDLLNSSKKKQKTKNVRQVFKKYDLLKRHELIKIYLKH